jgi:NitT/TauT family transport system ATP-binding protein
MNYSNSSVSAIGEHVVTDAKPIVSVKHVAKTFVSSSGDSTLALDDISVDLADGEFVTIVGPSGCGKSTLLYIIAGLVAASRGEVTIAGNPVTGPDPRLGIVFQEFRIFPWLNVMRNATFGLDVRGALPKRERLARAGHYLKMVGLSGFENRFPKELSGGMKQRLAMAQTFACDPSVVLMDEPMGSVDALTRETLQDEILKLWNESRKSIMLVTHSIEEAIYLGSRLVVMSPRPGRIIKAFDVPLPYPRTRDMRTTPEAANIRNEVWQLIQEGANR